jgi:hypothetical protein
VQVNQRVAIVTELRARKIARAHAYADVEQALATIESPR